MNYDPKRELLRHMVATVVFRGRIAIADAPPDFAEFRISPETRSPVEILAHIGDLLLGTRIFLQGGYIEIGSDHLSWNEEIQRLFATAKELDEFLASGTPLALPVERFVQGPVGDALTHVGQIVLLRRIAGAPIREEPYFTADIVPGVFE